MTLLLLAQRPATIPTVTAVEKLTSLTQKTEAVCKLALSLKGCFFGGMWLFDDREFTVTKLPHLVQPVVDALPGVPLRLASKNVLDAIRAVRFSLSYIDHPMSKFSIWIPRIKNQVRDEHAAPKLSVI